jgi:hypothetical protein
MTVQDRGPALSHPAGELVHVEIVAALILPPLTAKVPMTAISNDLLGSVKTATPESKA